MCSSPGARIMMSRYLAVNGMKKLLAAWRNSIFLRLLIIFLTILIPLYFGGIAIYSWGASAVQQEISQSISAQGAAWLDAFEQEVERIRLLEYECLTDPDLDLLSVRSDALDALQRTEAVTRLLDRLAAVQSSSRYIQSATIHIPAIGRALLSRGSTTELSPADFNRLVPEAALKYPLKFEAGQARLTAVYPTQNLGSRAARYLIVVSLSVPDIRNSLASMDESGGRGAMLRGEGLALATGMDDASAARLAAEADKAGVGKGTSIIRTDSGSYLVSRTDSQSLGVSLYRFAPEGPLMAPLYRYRLWFGLFTAAAVGIIVMFTVASRRLIDQAYRQTILAQKAELKHLQSQINPHFLFNSFFLLQNMVERGDNDGASEFTRQLGAYFQFVTRSASDEVTLGREIAHARAYTGIQSRRFRGRISVEFDDLPREAEGIIVPRLIVQPVIENAFDHGLGNKMSGGKLRVAFHLGDTLLVISVEDNGDMTPEGAAALNARLESGDDAQEATALLNIHRRLRIRFGAAAGLRFAAVESGGLRAELRMPLPGGGQKNVPTAHR